MNTKINLIIWFNLLIFISNSHKLYADVILPKLLSDNMIIQRNEHFKIWGWADANEKIEVIFLGSSTKTKADKNGNWSVTFKKQNSSQSFSIYINGKNSIEIKNVVFGDVFLCSGQSNMELAFNRIKHKYPDEVTTAYNPLIRQFQVPDGYDFCDQHTDYISGNWKAVNQTNIFEFSGVAYFFAKKIYEKTKVPIGIINCAYGGSDAFAWLDEKTVKEKLGNYYEESVKFKSKEIIEEIIKNEIELNTLWCEQINSNDEGVKHNWKNNTDFNSWKITYLPNKFEKIWNYNLPKNVVIGENVVSQDIIGIIYFSKEINIDDPAKFDSAKLELGRIIDSDSTFINGNYVGNITYQYPPRRYILNKNYFKRGKNIITVKVTVNNGQGAFVKDRKYELTTTMDTIKLDGEWYFKIGSEAKWGNPGSTNFNTKPFGVYNYMIHPLANLKFKAVLWNQGETNLSNPHDYKYILENLVGLWRKKFNNKNLPFIYVQMPLYGDPEVYNHNSEWAALRNQQYKMQTIKNAYMITALDAGEHNDLHPENKKDVGERIAYKALRYIYNSKGELHKFPILKNWKVNENNISITFENLDLLSMTDEVLKRQFYFIDEQDKFIEAKVHRNGDSLIMTSDDFKNKKFLRYAWANNPLFADLKSSNGLPLSPFSLELKY